MKLTDKYTLEQGRVYLTGIQALVRLPMDQMRRDRRAGLNTAGFISGYEGSPLGGYDLALERAGKLLDEHRIHFVPGVNEDLAATAVFGSQIYQILGRSRADGVLGIWYGKGPGVDRSGDILRHANLAGSAGLSAALVLAGDDHVSKSSTIPHQSDLSLYNLGIPVLAPGNTQEILDYGLFAVALSRFSGSWVGLKLVTNVCDGGGTIDVDPGRPGFVSPEGYQKKTDPRLVPPMTLALEYEVNVRRLEAVRDFLRANPINRSWGAREGAWLGIATAGKPYYDLAQALADLGVGAEALESIGVRIAKFGMTFPVETRFAREFAEGLERIVVIEEKRSFLEFQLRDALYNLPRRPLILGKEDEHGRPLLAATAELDPDRIARVVAEQILARHPLASARARLARIEEIAQRPKAAMPLARLPNYCPGCPHNRSTLLLEGQVAGGGIGCHGMGIMLGEASRGYEFVTHMGGEGAAWIGMAPFVERGHIFQNLGDGTYFHSGSLAIEAAIAAGVNITYKLLYNGHVAMTGGQAIVGALPIPELTRKLEAEGVARTVVLAEDVARYEDRSRLAANVEVRDRFELAAVLGELEQVRGVSVMIYDQQCAAEKRRWRSRGKLEEPAMRLVVHEEVCEGCGDCVRQSNCMSLQPVATEFGEKIRIHQSSCNKDYSCALGDCPSFLTVRLKPGTGLRRRPLPVLPPAEVPPPPERVAAGAGYRIIAPGIGGTGVVTINALVATAALIDGLSVITLDQTGLAQKGGAVVSHLILSREPLEASARINAGNADLILGFDLIGAGHPENLKCAHPDRTTAVINTDLIPTSETIRRNQVLAGPEHRMAEIDARTRRGRNVYLDASRLAEELFGSHLFTNILLLGAAWQSGLVPVSLASIEEAIRLNGVDADRNVLAFLWGRKAYLDGGRRGAIAEKPAPADPVKRRAAELGAYQSAAYGRRYERFVERVSRQDPALGGLVALYLYKLMAYKDEYEVARLLTKPALESRHREQWEAVEAVHYNLHPPLLRRLGLHRKISLGPWFRWVLLALARLRFLRGTPFDIFGYSAHRRRERSLIGWYREIVEELLARLTPESRELALQIAALPDQIRGYERIKDASIERVLGLAADKLAELGMAAETQAVIG